MFMLSLVFGDNHEEFVYSTRELAKDETVHAVQRYIDALNKNLEQGADAYTMPAWVREEHLVETDTLEFGDFQASVFLVQMDQPVDWFQF